MLKKLFYKLQELEEHHQVLFALLVIFGVVCFSWGIEKLLQEYVFKKPSFYSYLAAIVLGLFVLWLTKHIVLNVI